MLWILVWNETYRNIISYSYFGFLYYFAPISRTFLGTFITFFREKHIHKWQRDRKKEITAKQTSFWNCICILANSCWSWSAANSSVPRRSSCLSEGGIAVRSAPSSLISDSCVGNFSSVLPTVAIWSLGQVPGFGIIPLNFQHQLVSHCWFLRVACQSVQNERFRIEASVSTNQILLN